MLRLARQASLVTTMDSLKQHSESLHEVAEQKLSRMIERTRSELVCSTPKARPRLSSVALIWVLVAFDLTHVCAGAAIGSLDRDRARSAFSSHQAGAHHSTALRSDGARLADYRYLSSTQSALAIAETPPCRTTVFTRRSSTSPTRRRKLFSRYLLLSTAFLSYVSWCFSCCYCFCAEDCHVGSRN